MLIRKAELSDAAAIAKVHVDSWRSTYRGMVPDEFLNSMSYEERTKRWIGILGMGKLVYIAANESGDIVGFADGGAERSGDPEYKGELYAIYLLKSYQRLGIGKKLVAAVMEGLAQLGYRSMLIWVLENNRHVPSMKRLAVSN